MNENNSEVILFFDGVCNLCNRVVSFLITRKSKKQIFYATLQGETASRKLERSDTQSLDSVIIWNQGQVLKKSRAAFFVLDNLDHGFIKWLLVFKFLPTSLTDLVYDLVAQSRYQIFGKTEICRWPSSSEKKLFLP